MPKIGVDITEVSKSSIENNINTAEYLLEGRIDHENLYEKVDFLSGSGLIQDHPTITNPITGDKFVAGDTFKDEVLQPLINEFRAYTFPVVLSGRASFLLNASMVSDQTSNAIQTKKALQFAGVNTRRDSLREATAQAAASGIDRVLAPFLATTKYNKQIVLEKPLNIVVMTPWEIENFFGTAPVRTNVNYQFFVQGKFASAIASEDKPKIYVSDSNSSADSLIFDVVVECPPFDTDDYLTIELQVDVLCKIMP